jgi:hypothetical protein
MTNLPPEAERVVREVLAQLDKDADDWAGARDPILSKRARKQADALRAIVSPEPSARGGLREKLAALANRIQDDLFVTPGEHNVGVEIRRILAETPEADYGPLVEWAIAHRQWLRFNAPSADDALKAAGIE